MINRYLRSFETPLTGLRFNSCQKPCFFFAARLNDNFRTHRIFSDGFGHEQRNNRTGKADDGRIRQQAADLVRTVDAEDSQNNPDDD